jgi:DNA-binding response OmpR family regulator
MACSAGRVQNRRSLRKIAPPPSLQLSRRADGLLGGIPFPQEGAAMDSPSTPRVVVVLDSDPDTTELLKSMLELAGMVVATGNLAEFRLGRENLIAFLRRVAPDVILYDLGLPYESNYRFLQQQREHPDFPPCGLVITSTNARAVESLLGVRAIEIVGKPYDIDVLVRAVQAASLRHAASAAAKVDEERRHSDRRQDDRRHGDRRTGPPDARTPPVH